MDETIEQTRRRHAASHVFVHSFEYRERRDDGYWFEMCYRCNQALRDHAEAKVAA